VCWDGDVGRVAYDFVGDAPFTVGDIAFGEVEGACYDADAGVAGCQAPTEIFEVCPVIAVKAFSNLRTHICEIESIVHGILTPFGVCRGDLMSSVVA